MCNETHGHPRSRKGRHLTTDRGAYAGGAATGYRWARQTIRHGRPDRIAARTPYGIYFFRSTTHSQCESPRTMFLVSLNVKFGFTLAATPSPQF